MESPSSQHSWNVLQQADTYVTKIGGENAADFAGNATMIAARLAQGKKQILAVSALRSSDPRYSQYTHQDAADRDKLGKIKHGFNATSHLIAMASHFREGDREGARDILDRIRRFTKDIVRADTEQHPLPHAKSILCRFDALIDRHVDGLSAQMDGAQPEDVLALEKDWLLRSPSSGIVSLTGFGEELAQTLTVQGLAVHGIRSCGIHTAGLTEAVLGDLPEETVRQESLTRQAIDSLRDTLRYQLALLLPSQDVLVAGGYLPILGGQRGYSDKTGALLAQVAKQAGNNVAYLIEKRSPVLSADPALKLEGTRVVEHMTPHLALEVFGNVHGADGGAIHPDALQMLADAEVDTFVLNPADSHSGSITHIHPFDPSPGGIEMVAMRPMPLALRIRTTKMFGKPGFLKRVTDWFSARNISIDQVLTSEVTASFTFANGGVDDNVLQSFRSFLEDLYGKDLGLDVIRDRALLFGLGNNISGIAPVTTLLHGLEQAGISHADFLMQSTREVITAVIPREMAAAALARIHESCIAN